MRIVGEIDHQKYKITIFKMNERLSVKIEDRLLEQIYKFRDGSGIQNSADVEKLLTPAFMGKVAASFSTMQDTYQAGIEDMLADEGLGMEII